MDFQFSFHEFAQDSQWTTLDRGHQNLALSACWVGRLASVDCQRGVVQKVQACH